MSNQNGYIGRAPADSSIIIASQVIEPAGIQTTFTFNSGYDAGYLDVYKNGSKLVVADDYTATDGSTVSLTSSVGVGTVLELVAYKAFNLSNPLSNTSGGPLEVGTDLTVGGATTGTSAYYTGTVTGTFVGDGSGLTGVASTDNIITSTASTFTGAVNITGAAGGNLLNVSGITTVGILTVYDTTQSTSSSTGGLVIHGGVGIAKSLFVDGNVTIGGTLKYEDMTNTDTLGFGTFRKGIEVQGAGSTTTTLKVTGVSSFVGFSTFTDDVFVAGILTAGEFKGPLTGTVTGDATGLTGSPNILCGTGGFTGNVTVGSGVTLGPSGIITATAYHGDGGENLWVLGADGTSHYTFTGPGDLSAENDPTLNLVRGQRYVFRNRSGGHPFRIQSTSNGATGTAYNDGVTNNDAGNGTDLIFDVPYDAPNILFYQCTAHANMGGVLYIGNSWSSIQVGTALTIGPAGVSTFYKDVTLSGDVTFKGDSYDLLWDKSTDDLKFPDNASAKFGTGNDMSIYHTGSHGYISNDVGDLILGAGNGVSIKLQPEGGEDGLTVTHNAAVDLYYNNSLKFSTTGYGVTVKGGSYVSGVTTAFGGWHGGGTLVESFSSTTTAYNSNGNLNISNGNVQFSSANLGGTGSTLNIMSTTGINTDIRVNQALNVTAFTAVNATTAFVNKVTIDGKATGITTHWVGGSVPEDGGGSGVDTYSFNILKTGSETYIIVANQVKTS